MEKKVVESCVKSYEYKCPKCGALSTFSKSIGKKTKVFCSGVCAVAWFDAHEKDRS